MSLTTQPRLRQNIERAGWRGLTETVWEKLSDFRLVIIAPPLDTVPSPTGNAIYTLVEDLALRLPEATLVLARWPERGSPMTAPISNQILYDTRPLKPGWIERRLPYRLKRYITGSGAPFYYEYARRAAQLTRLLMATRIIIEDIPVFVLQVRHYLRPEQLLFLHQHNDAFKSVSRSFCPRVIRNLDGVIFASRQTLIEAEQLHGRLPIPVGVVHNGVSLLRYNLMTWKAQASHLRERLEMQATTKVLLYVGRIIPDKGIVEAVEAFVSANVPDSHFVIVGDLENSLYGDESYTQRLRSVTRKASGQVHLVGKIGQSELPAFYALADMVIVPSLGREGLPKVITEALAMEVPCIVTRRGGALELIEHGRNGWVVPEPATVENMRASIQCAFAELHQVRVQGSTREAVSIGRMVAEFANFIKVPQVSAHASWLGNRS